MNYKMVIHTVGQVVLLEAGLLVLPLLVSLYYGDSCSMAYLQTIAIAAVVGSLMTFAVRPKNHNVFAKEGFSIVSVGWLILSAIGALPFTFSGDIPSYVDAFFETVSGFTTTGASILTDVEVLMRGNLFWRSFNREMLLDIAAKYEGTIIIPMTVTDRRIWNELTGSFERDSFKPFILSASKETLLKRLASRFDGKNSWGAQQIDRCITALEDSVFGYPIITDHLTIEQTAEAIAKQAGIPLSPDNRSAFIRLFDRIRVQIHHIR